MQEAPRDWNLINAMFRSHPWHGVEIGRQAPEIVTAYIEIVPTDTVKYEIDKVTGFLKVDRPQKYSNVSPCLYGFIPQTFCAENLAALTIQRTGRSGIVGDGDPLDICVLTENSISHGDILVEAAPIGGLRMLDGDEADDKIIAVLKGDAVYGHWRDLGDCTPEVIERLRHYFLTYKNAPGEVHPSEVTHVYDRAEAHEVIRRCQRDYQRHFGTLVRSIAPS